MNRGGPQKKLFHRLRTIGLVAGLGFMAWLLWRLLNDPGLLSDRLSIAGFTQALAVGVIANAFVGMAFSELVAKSTPGVGPGRRLAAFYYSQAAKYIPGRIAALIVQRSIITGPNALSATIVSNLELMAVSAWLCTNAALALLLASKSAMLAAVLLLASVALGAWLLRLNWQPATIRLQCFLPAWLQAGLHPPSTHQTTRLRAIALSLGIFIMPAASNYVLLTSGMGIENPMAMQLTALLMLSWVAGMLAFIFPAGIGVRELVFYGAGLSLPQGPGPDLMVGIALASRLVQVLIDAAGMLLFFLAQRWLVFSGAYDEH